MNARRLFIATMGCWMGAAGIEHGVGEFLQGHVAPAGIMIRSWPEADFFASLNGEPAMTILPDLRLTGILAIGISLLFAGWAIFGAERKQHGLGLMLLGIPMLLFGGGIFPPVLGALIGAAAAATASAAQRPAASPVRGLRRWAGRAWPWIFAACCTAWLAILPGIAVLHTFFGIDDAGLTLAIIAAAFALLPAAFWSGLQHDRLAFATLRNTTRQEPQQV